jgi:hypothetical protein
MKLFDEESPVRVALFKESAGDFKGWIAQCLDLNLVAQGKSIEEAQASFHRTFVAHVYLSIHKRKDPFSGILIRQIKQKTKERSIDCEAGNLKNLRIAYSQLNKTETVPAW